MPTANHSLKAVLTNSAVTSSVIQALDSSSVRVKPSVVMELSNNRVNQPNVFLTGERNKQVIIDGVDTPSMKFAFTDSIYTTDSWARVWVSDDRYDSQIPWISDTKTDSSGNFAQPVSITVNYQKAVRSNKIVLSTDPFGMGIKEVTIEIDKGSGYQVIADKIVMDDYLLELYLQSADGNNWSTIINNNHTVLIYGMRAKIYSLYTEGYAHVYELDARLESDVSEDVMSMTIVKNRDLSSQTISPVGISTANSLDLTLDNTSNKYNNENIGTIYRGMLSPNTKFEVAIGVLTNNNYTYIRQGTFYADVWSLTDDTTKANISARDASKFLQDKQVPQLFYQGVAIGEIVRDIVERAGILDFDIDTSRLSSDIVRPSDLNRGEFTNIEDIVCIPSEHTVWTDEDKSYWEFLQEIAIADLAVFYFDDDGKFKFRVKESLTDPNHPDMGIKMKLDQDTHIISATYKSDIIKNVYTVDYFIPRLSRSRAGLWEADTPTILDATTLGGSINATDTVIPAGDISDWHDEGYFKVDNEIIKYERRSDTAFYECIRGVLGTSPAPHSGGTIIYEVRKFEFEYAITPASDFSLLNTNEVYTDIIAEEYGPFRGTVYLLNKYPGKTIVHGTHVTKALDGVPEALILAGRAIEQEEPEKFEYTDDISALKFGKQELNLSIPWVQSKKHAKTLIDYLTKVYSSPVLFVNATTFLLPYLDVGDMVSLRYDRLGYFVGRSFHVVGITINYTGSDISQSLELRSRAGETALPSSSVRIWQGVDAKLKKTITQYSWHAVEANIGFKTISGKVETVIRLRYIRVTYDVDVLKFKPYVTHGLDAYIPPRVSISTHIDVYIKYATHVFSVVDVILKKYTSRTHSLDARIS